MIYKKIPVCISIAFIFEWQHPDRSSNQIHQMLTKKRSGKVNLQLDKSICCALLYAPTKLSVKFLTSVFFCSHSLRVTCEHQFLILELVWSALIYIQVWYLLFGSNGFWGVQDLKAVTPVHKIELLRSPFKIFTHAK